MEMTRNENGSRPTRIGAAYHGQFCFPARNEPNKFLDTTSLWQALTTDSNSQELLFAGEEFPTSTEAQSEGGEAVLRKETSRRSRTQCPNRAEIAHTLAEVLRTGTSA